jgi:hypothetical protein
MLYNKKYQIIKDGVKNMSVISNIKEYREKNKKRLINFRLKETTIEKLKIMSETNNLTMTEIIEHLIDEIDYEKE